MQKSNKYRLTETGKPSFFSNDKGWNIHTACGGTGLNNKPESDTDTCTGKKGGKHPVICQRPTRLDSSCRMLKKNGYSNVLRIVVRQMLCQDQHREGTWQY